MFVSCSKVGVDVKICADGADVSTTVGVSVVPIVGASDSVDTGEMEGVGSRSNKFDSGSDAVGRGVAGAEVVGAKVVDEEVIGAGVSIVGDGVVGMNSDGLAGIVPPFPSSTTQPDGVSHHTDVGTEGSSSLTEDGIELSSTHPDGVHHQIDVGIDVS